MTKEFREIGKSSTANLVTKGDKDRYWKRILVVDDDVDITTTFKIGIESTQANTNKKIEVYTYHDPRIALLDFEPNFYDLLLIDIKYIV